MNALTIARWDFRNVRRSRSLRAFTGVLTVLFCLFVFTSDPDPSQDGVFMSLSRMFGVVALLAPILVFPVTVMSITGERTSGSIKYLLGLPNTRFDVYVGKFASRVAITSIGITVAFAISSLFMWIRFGFPLTRDFGTFVGITILYASVWVAISIAVSGISRAKGTAFGGVLAMYFLFAVLWNFLPGISPTESTAFLVESVLNMSPKPNLYQFVKTLSPTFAYVEATQHLVFQVEHTHDLEGVNESAFYLQGWFMPVLKLGWIAITLAIGYARFRATEIV